MKLRALQRLWCISRDGNVARSPAAGTRASQASLAAALPPARGVGGPPGTVLGTRGATDPGTSPPSNIRAAPSVRPARPEVMAQSCSARLEGMAFDTAIGRPSDETTTARALPG